MFEKRTALFTLYSIFLFTSCSDPKIEGKYFSEDEYSYIEFVESKTDTLFAKHCFVMASGNRIDCCVDDISINLIKSGKNTYSGKLHSCYDQEYYDMELSMSSRESRVSIDDSYPFIKSWLFKKSN